MDPQLISQLRQALRKNGITIQTDVRSYAKSLGLQTGRAQASTSAAPQVEPEAPSTSATGSPATTQYTNLQQQMLKLIDNKLPAPLMPFKVKFSNKVKSTSSYPQLKLFATDLLDLIKKAQTAQQANPKAAQAVTQSMDMFMKQAEQKAPANSQMDQIQNKFINHANTALTTKAESLKLVEIYPNLKQYNVNGSNPVSVTIPYTGPTDTSMVVGVPLAQGDELLALGFASRRYGAWLTGDSGRVAEAVLGHLFDIRSGDETKTIKPAVKSKDGALQKGQIQLPLP
jgi:hypothetical protein